MSVEFRHSGGATNNDPNADLGGALSTHTLGTGLDCLFGDLSADKALAGYIDFRCFYVVNLALPLSTTNVWIDSQVPSGADVTLGFQLVNEVQNVVVSVVSSTPTFTDASVMILQMAEYGAAFTVPAFTDPAAMAAKFQEMVRVVPGLSLVTVAALGDWPVVTFVVTFLGEAGNHNQQLMAVIQNNLGVGSGVVVSKITAGSPVNTTAPAVALDIITPPPFISFTDPLAGSPVSLGTLHANDFCPVWVRRYTAAGTLALANDGFSLGLSGNYP